MITIEKIEQQERETIARVTSALHYSSQQKAKANAINLSTKITKAVIEKRPTAKRLQNVENSIYTVIDSLHNIAEYSYNIDDKRLVLMILNAITQFSLCDSDTSDADILRQELNCEIFGAQNDLDIDDEAEATISFHKNTLKIEY